MHPCRVPYRRLATLVAVAASLGAVSVVPVATAALAAPTYTRNEPAIAAASPSLVYLEITYTGYVRDSATGAPRSPEPVSFQRRCTGVVVDPVGDALTTSVCVRPTDDIVLVNALYKLGRDLVAAGQLAAGQLDSYVGGLTGRSTFTGVSPGTKADAALFAQVDIAVPRTTGPPAIPATVVAAQAATDGDAALVRLSEPGLPAIELDTAATLGPGNQVVILGYGPGSSQATADDYTIRAKTVGVTGRTASNRLGVDGDIGPDSRGGAVVDTDGRLVALLDTDSAAPDDPTHDLVTMLHLNALLAQAGITNRLAAPDRDYRAALASYFAGRYSRAAPAFDAVLRESPSMTAAATYRTRAQERLRTEGDAVANQATWAGYGLAAVLGVAIIALLNAAAAVARRRTGRGRR